MSLHNSPEDLTFDHKHIVNDAYTIAAAPYLLFLSVLHRNGFQFPSFNTDDLTVTITRDIDRVFQVHFIKADGHECAFQLLGQRQCQHMRESIKIRMINPVQLTTRNKPYKNRQAIGHPYWFHRLIMLYSKVIRGVTPEALGQLPHCHWVFPTPDPGTSAMYPVRGLAQ